MLPTHYHLLLLILLYLLIFAVILQEALSKEIFQRMDIL